MFNNVIVYSNEQAFFEDVRICLLQHALLPYTSSSFAFPEFENHHQRSLSFFDEPVSPFASPIMRSTFLYTLGQLAALALAHLDKAPLTKDLNYLHAGLVAHLPPQAGTYSKWDPGWIPADCKAIIESKQLSATDVQVYSVHYNDCNTPWIMCRHKASLNPLLELIDHFSRVPVRSRQWVRHVIDLPDHSSHQNYAFNANGNIALINKADATLAVLIHETAHSLDLQFAFQDKPLSGSKTWNSSFAKDSKVPDGYAQTRMIEDVAQNTVVATYNLNVPGGFANVQPGWKAIYNQYSTVQTEASGAGNLLVPGGTCWQRMANSPPVQTSDKRNPFHGRGVVRPRANEMVPDVSLPEEIDEIEPVEFNTEKLCRHAW